MFDETKLMLLLLRGEQACEEIFRKKQAIIFITKKRPTGVIAEKIAFKKKFVLFCT